jgi:hypothetical protein
VGAPRTLARAQAMQVPPLTEEEDDPEEVRGTANGMAEGAGAESGGKGSRADEGVGASPGDVGSGTICRRQRRGQPQSSVGDFFKIPGHPESSTFTQSSLRCCSIFYDRTMMAHLESSFTQSSLPGASHESTMMAQVSLHLAA